MGITLPGAPQRQPSGPDFDAISHADRAEQHSWRIAHAVAAAADKSGARQPEKTCMVEEQFHDRRRIRAASRGPLAPPSLQRPGRPPPACRVHAGDTDQVR